MINMTAKELGELRKLILHLEGLRAIAPTGFDVYDVLGQKLGTITALDHAEWGFETNGDPDGT